MYPERFQLNREDGISFRETRERIRPKPRVLITAGGFCVHHDVADAHIFRQILERQPHLNGFPREVPNQQIVHAQALIPSSQTIHLRQTRFKLQLLTDDSHQFGFSPEEETAIRRSVPWTRRLQERKTNYRSHAIDLVPYVRSQRHNFILKPNDDYGGRGISFGNQLSEGEWDRAVCSAMAGDYVVQEIVDLQTEDFPIFDNDRWALQPMFVDTNPFVFRGRVDGAMVRLSNSRVVNVSSGGGETGFFVIEGMTR